MAFRAGDCEVPAGQDELSLLVLGEGKCRRLVALQRVAAITRVEIRRGRKLSRVTIGVAVGTVSELDFEESVFPFRGMALHTLQASMSALQGIRRRRVFLHCE